MKQSRAGYCKGGIRMKLVSERGQTGMELVGSRLFPDLLLFDLYHTSNTRTLFESFQMMLWQSRGAFVLSTYFPCTWSASFEISSLMNFSLGMHRKCSVSQTCNEAGTLSLSAPAVTQWAVSSSAISPKLFCVVLSGGFSVPVQNIKCHHQIAYCCGAHQCSNMKHTRI